MRYIRHNDCEKCFRIVIFNPLASGFRITVRGTPCSADEWRYIGLPRIARRTILRIISIMCAANSRSYETNHEQRTRKRIGKKRQYP